MSSEQIIASILTHLTTKIDQKIQIIQLLKKTPQFIHSDITTKLHLQFQASFNDPQPVTRTGMVEQHLNEVKILGKDSLMPKGVEKESEEIDQVTKLAESVIKTKKKGLNNTKTSFNRSNIHSVNSNTNRNSKITAFSKKKSKKQQDLNLIALTQYQPDPEVQKLWKLKDAEIQVREKQIKAEQAKRKQYQTKKQNFTKELSQKQYTFDFEGDAIPSIQDQDKINYHSMKMRLSLMDKKLRSNINFKEGQNIIDLKLQKRPSITLAQNSFSVELTSIPVFKPENSVDTSAIFGLPSQKQKCKLKQFKKHYGGRFSRLDRSLNTIDVTSQKNDEYNQIFSERRHFKDEEKSINQSMISYRTRIEHATRRKLALPKIHGKYSTLDRYQS